VKQKSLCLIGMFPPPLHGMSLINDYVRKRVGAREIPLVIDFSPRNLDRSFVVRFGKIFRVTRCALQFFTLLLRRRVGAVYLGLSGGNGQIYDAIFVALSRLFGRRLYLHHHSYQYLNQFRLVAKVLFLLAGKNAVHVVACEKMAGDLRQKYHVTDKVRIISGIAALEAWDGEVRKRDEIKSIGFLSNISIEKGILEFLDVAAWADQVSLPVCFYLAGPYQDQQVRAMVENRIASLSKVTCIGGVYGEDKQKFFDSIDVFLFPTKYVNESEGLVIHEAMSRGVPVIAYSRGCIEQIVSDQVGLRLMPEQDYVAGASKKIEEWLSKPDLYQLASRASLNRFNESRSLHIKNMDALCEELIAT